MELRKLVYLARPALWNSMAVAMAEGVSSEKEGLEDKWEFKCSVLRLMCVGANATTRDKRTAIT